MSNIDFSHRSYTCLLEHITGLGRPIVSFREVPKSGPYAILRHDIDFSIAKAVEIASLDSQAGARSTFFVLMTTPYYNPLDEENIARLQSIAGLGHEIGLHVDCSGFDALTFAEQYNRLQNQISCLEAHLGIRVTSIAQHKPTAARMRPEFPGYRDAYSRPFFSDIAYISDSRMMFRVRDVYEFLDQHERCQLVLHPIWWHRSPRTRSEVFEGIRTELAHQFSRMIDDEHRIILDFLSTYVQP
jgi:hypothetical protein